MASSATAQPSNQEDTDPALTGGMVQLQPQELFRTLSETLKAPPSHISSSANHASISAAGTGATVTGDDPGDTDPKRTGGGMAPLPVPSGNPRSILQDEDIISSDDDNTHGHSNSSSVQGTYPAHPHFLPISPQHTLT